MLFNATFNNISVISWRSVFLVGETGVPGENHRHVASHWQTLSHNVYRVHLSMNGVRTLNFSGEGSYTHLTWVLHNYSRPDLPVNSLDTS